MATLSNFSPIVHRSMWGPNCSCEYTCHGQHGGASFHRKLTHPRLHVNMYQKLCSHQGTQLLGVLRHDTMWPATTVVTQLAVNVNHRLFAVPCLELTSFAHPLTSSTSRSPVSFWLPADLECGVHSVQSGERRQPQGPPQQARRHRPGLRASGLDPSGKRTQSYIRGTSVQRTV